MREIGAVAALLLVATFASGKASTDGNLSTTPAAFYSASADSHGYHSFNEDAHDYHTADEDAHDYHGVNGASAIIQA